jgi:hypothetical protein
MAICRADGSSAEEALLVADHLVLANLFGHDSHGVGMMPAYIQNTTTAHFVRNHHAKIARDNGAVIVIDGASGYGQVIAKEAMGLGEVSPATGRSRRSAGAGRAGAAIATFLLLATRTLPIATWLVAKSSTIGSLPLRGTAAQ